MLWGLGPGAADWPLPILQEFDIVDRGPDKFLYGFEDYVYTKMGSRTDVSVWKCAKAAKGYDTTGQCLYFFKIGELYLTAHGDETMVTPQEVQAAYIAGRMPVFGGSLLEDDDGEGAIEPGYHAWDFFIDGHWAQRDAYLLTAWMPPGDGHVSD